MNNKRFFTFLFIVIIVIILVVIVIGSRNNNSQESTSTKESPTPTAKNINLNSIIFFYGKDCPHCKETEEWMKENKIEEKITIIKKEIGEAQNTQELIQAAKSCNLQTNSIGVPFLYADGKCFIGSPDVEAYLTKKAGIIPSEGSKK